ncbi:NADPH-dependent ferric siderophore reductase [Pseudonocardia hierapolitana]|uniref:NADPH-dependent ferric siderophore reductase n=1 Tax=Pseudonocardia hierapolitana TaxID=1128676 RepID=A0A561T023_9PSEU|nr:siderophore-interacting protein [Pseudonocardia hierapolitana]TWF80451.1 NADPH-dependent ferric siderophore reductase [Pseudonocardia hierapolitana]
MIPKLRLPQARTMITLEVRRRESLTPSFASLTLGGPALQDLIVAGGDQTVRLFFPREGQTALRMPTASNEAWMAQVLLMPKSVRPQVRNMTIRRARPAEDEIDIEFALHGDSPMSSWVRRVRPGDPAGIFDMGTTYRPPEYAQSQLLVGDETALPAILAIVDQAPPSLTAEVYLEVPTSADARDVVAPPGVRIHWFSRDDVPEQRPGAVVLEAVRHAAMPPGRVYAWIAGESRLATSVRRHLVNDRGVPKADISFAGYWRHGWSAPG